MAGTSESSNIKYTGKHFSRLDKMRQNDNPLTGETWKLIPHTDFAYVSSLGRFATSMQVDFPHSGAYLCTEEELRSQVNYYANMENILSEAEGHTNVDYYTMWMYTMRMNAEEEDLSYATDTMRD